MNIIKHFKLITKHKWVVFKLCCKAGIPFRGLVHDLSKYNPIEFFESAKYYTGNHSPIVNCRKDKGYSNAWLHHKAKNKHHFEYWLDLNLPDLCAVMPFKYTVEMICDQLSAGIIYQGKNWTQDYQLRYFKNCKDRNYINPKIRNVLDEVFTQVSIQGIDKTIKKKNLKKIYYNIVNNV